MTAQQEREVIVAWLLKCADEASKRALSADTMSGFQKLDCTALTLRGAALDIGGGRHLTHQESKT